MLLTIDIGTSAFKSALWDFDGNRLSFAKVSLSACQNIGLKHEAESGQWLRAFADCCGRLGDLRGVQAIVISGNGPSLIPVFGEPGINEKSIFLSAEPARLWLDRRAVKEAGEVSELMGGFVDAAFFIPKVLYIKNNEPRLYEKTKYFLGCPEYMAYALCGQAKSVFPSQGFDRWFWNDDILEKLKLDTAKFPPFINSGDVYGTLLPEAAARFGFAHNTPVIAGGPDFFAAIIGAGVCKPEQACDRAGTSEGINLCTENRINDWRLLSYGHPVKPYWNLSGVISTTGKAIEWCSNLLDIGNIEQFYSLAENAKPGAGALVFLPFLAGERTPYWNPDVNGVWRGLNLSTGRKEFVRSVLEGIGFAIRDVISVMKETGANVNELRVTGAAAGSCVLNQIKADITGKTVISLVQKEAELSGLAMIGAITLGEYGSFAEASEKFVRIEKTYEPQPENTALYEELFQKYKETCQIGSTAL